MRSRTGDGRRPGRGHRRDHARRGQPPPRLGPRRARDARLRVAAAHAGTNSNVLADETADRRRLSGNAVLNGIPVELAPVRPAARPACRRSAGVLRSQHGARPDEHRRPRTVHGAEDAARHASHAISPAAVCHSREVAVKRERAHAERDVENRPAAVTQRVQPAAVLAIHDRGDPTQRAEERERDDLDGHVGARAAPGNGHHQRRPAPARSARCGCSCSSQSKGTPHGPARRTSWSAERIRAFAQLTSARAGCVGAPGATDAGPPTGSAANR